MECCQVDYMSLECPNDGLSPGWVDPDADWLHQHWSPQPGGTWTRRPWYRRGVLWWAYLFVCVCVCVCLSASSSEELHVFHHIFVHVAHVLSSVLFSRCCNARPGWSLISMIALLEKGGITCENSWLLDGVLAWSSRCWSPWRLHVLFVHRPLNYSAMWCCCLDWLKTFAQWTQHHVAIHMHSRQWLKWLTQLRFYTSPDIK